MSTGAPGLAEAVFGGKCPAGWAARVGWTHSCLIPPTALARFQALQSTKLPFLGSGTAGPRVQGAALSVRGQHRMPGGERDRGPIRSVLPLELQGSRGRLPEPSAAPFLLGKQVLSWASPSVPKLSWALGLVPKLLPKVAAGVPEQEAASGRG